MTYNTGNPLGSTDPMDLYDNAQNFDNAINGNSRTWKDRFGVDRYTWKGALDNIAPLGHPWTEVEADAAIASGEIPNLAYYFVWSKDSNNIADVWQNVNGVGQKTGKSYPSSEFVFKLQNKVDFVYDSNAKNVSGFPGVAEMATDKKGNVTYRRLEDGTSQFPAVMVGSRIEQVQGAKIGRAHV